ncbi:MAG: hypothetical protein RL477_492 [Pseudomonadota bacterium]|jgi:hypothetical protein
MRVLVAVLMLCAIAGLSACTPESVHPLPERLRVTADERLVGTWRGSSWGNDYVAVITAGAPGTLEVELTTSVAGRGERMKSRHTLSFYDVSGMKLIVERGTSLVDRTAVYRFAAYDVAPGGAVTLRFTSDREVYYKWAGGMRIAAVVRGSDENFHDVLLTADGEQVLAMLQSQPQATMFDVTFGPFSRQ